MNICLVGYGVIAQKHMEALSRIQDVHPYVLVGRRREPSAAFAQRWGFQHHSLDLEAALADPHVDAVIITSPNTLHVPQAEKALRAGKHVLLEIPIALDVDQAERVTKLARQVDRRLMICHTIRFIPAIREIHGRVKTGRLRMHQIVGFFGISRRTNTAADGHPRSWTDDILWHHGAHLVDTVLWTTGSHPPSEVTCRFGPQHPTQGVMDMSLSMVLPGDVLVTIAQSYNMSRFRWRMLFIGEQDTLEFDNGTLFDADGRVVVPHQSINDLYEQDQEFIAAVLEQRDPSITGEQVLPAMQVLQKAQACAQAAVKSFQAIGSPP